MAFLVLLPAAARARIVAAHLWLVAPHGDRLGIVATDPWRPLLARTRRRRSKRTGFTRLRARAGQRGRGARLGARIVQDERRATRCGTAGDRRFFVQHRPQPPQVANDLFVDAIFHRLEEIEALFLVLDE